MLVDILVAGIVARVYACSCGTPRPPKSGWGRSEPNRAIAVGSTTYSAAPGRDPKTNEVGVTLTITQDAFNQDKRRAEVWFIPYADCPRVKMSFPNARKLS